ncbi:MAG: GFA family protein, partial [Pseudomonadota bacterium]
GGVQEGCCLCGAIKVTLAVPAAVADACHCSMCRRLSGGGPHFAVEGDGRRPCIEGEAALRVYRSSDWAERAFCGICGTPIWYRFIEDDYHSISAGLFDGNELTLNKQIFIEEKPALYDLANDTPRLTGEEVIAEYMAKKNA